MSGVFQHGGNNPRRSMAPQPMAAEPAASRHRSRKQHRGSGITSCPWGQLRLSRWAGLTLSKLRWPPATPSTCLVEFAQMSAYLKQLNQALAARISASRPASLEQRFREWFYGQPDVIRNRMYSMQEFERALGVPGRLISPVLLRVGFQRKRKWNSIGQYHRYWQPPDQITICRP